MILNLKEMPWAEFAFDSIFEIHATNSGIDKNKLVVKNGKIPYVTRSVRDNGVDLFISKQNKVLGMENCGNVITVGLDTQTIFYQTYPFYTGQNIQIIACEDLNRLNAMFIIPLIKKQLEKFSWGGNGATLTRLRRSKVLLPVAKNGKPDFELMTQYIRHKEQKQLTQYHEQIKQKFNESDFSSTVLALEDKKWREFEIGMLFKFQQGKAAGLNHLEKIATGINYLGATNNNNGVLCQVQSIEALVQKGNCIAFIRNGEGSMGYSIYKAESFIATSDISVGYSSFLNRYVGMFITTVADKVRGKYNFGYKRSDRRLKKEKILLPVNKQGEPDFEYMENYMKKIEYKKLAMYVGRDIL